MQHTTSHQDHAGAFACPMHPEVKGHEGDECHKCGMKLEKVSPGGKVTMSLETDPKQIEAGKPVVLSFKPIDASNSSKLVELADTHEKKIHVIIVSEDLSWFDHIHAEPSGNGAYTVTKTFPNDRNYIVYADYKPSGGSSQTDKLPLRVGGAAGNALQHHTPKLVSKTDGYTVSVKNSRALATGNVEMPIVVEKDGVALKRKDLENYLGAVAHIILISQDEKEFIHIHPASTDEYPIFAHADIPKQGSYRMWVQFQTNGSVHTADFTLDVEQGPEHTPKHVHSGTGHKH